MKHISRIREETGGIAGVYYGYDNISEKWTENLSVKEELFMISNKISKVG